MLSLTRHIFAAAIVLGIVSIPSTVRSQTQADKKERTGSVSGRVTINGKGAPGVVVIMRENESSSNSPWHRDATDQDGNYRITGVSAGTYNIAPLAPAFVIADLNTSLGKSLLIGEREAVDGIDFALVRGGVITGKVIDADGRPVIEEGVDVSPIDRDVVPGTRSWRPHSPMGFQTDDRGIYRIFGLPPGRYVVSVGQSEGSMTDEPSYKQTFHPDVTDQAKATTIELTEGSEATNVDITVSGPVRVFSAKGRIINGENGHPMADLQFSLTRILDMSRSTSSSSNQRSNSQGEFRIDRLTPGKYSVSISPRPESDLRSEAVSFEILDQDVTGLVIKTSKVSGSLAGIVVFEGSQQQKEAAKFSDFYLTLRNENLDYWGSTSLGADGSFRFSGFPSGLANLSLGERERTKTRYTILRIERDGVIQPTGIELQKSEHISGIQIVVAAHRTGTIRGAVKIVNGTLPAGSHLFIHVTRVGESYSNFRPAAADARGHFIIEGLVAGNYELSVSTFVPGSQTQKPGPAVKQLVSVGEDAVTEVTMTLDVKQNPKSPSQQ